MNTIYPKIEKMDTKYIPKQRVASSYAKIRCKVCNTRLTKSIRLGEPVLYRIRMGMSQYQTFYLCSRCLKNLHKALSGVIQTDFEPLFEVHEK